jgi:tetratricopeptide (TPR) repeat protein
MTQLSPGPTETGPAHLVPAEHGPREAATRARRRRRAKYLLWSLPVVILLLVVATKLMGPAIVNQPALDRFDSGAYESAGESWTSLIEGDNLVEPYLPWFNRGDSLAAREDYTAAVDDFERALELAPADRACDVRVNLALSWESLGDIYVAGGYFQGAIQLYEQAKAVIAEGEDCDPLEPSGQALAEAGPRVQAKIDQSEQLRDALEQQQGEGPGTQQEQLDQLGQQQEQSDQEKATGDAADRGEEGGQSGYTEKPW